MKEAACIRASLLLNQTNTKKGYKTNQPEINKISEIFGLEFDKHIYKSLIDEIDFKDLKSLLANKNSSNKLQYFIQEFPPLMDRQDFTNIFSQILMTTSNLSTTMEIFEGLNKLLKLSYENQFKIIFSFFYSMCEKFQDEAKNLFMSKCHELYKENKHDQLSTETTQTIMLMINSTDVLKNDIFFTNTFINYIINTQNNGPNLLQNITQSSQNLTDEEFKQINDIDNLISENTAVDETIDFEKVLHDLGPLIINNSFNISSNTKNDLIDVRLDEKRLANFILFLCKHQNWVEDKENRYLNKVFLKSLNNDLSMTIDENAEKKCNVTWNIDYFYKMFKSQIDNLDFNLVFTYFDDSLFSIKDKKTFEYFLQILQKLKIPNFQNYLYGLIFKKWTNEINQIDFLNFLINNPAPELFSFKNCLGRKVKKNFELSNTNVNKNTINHLIDAWSCVDLIEILLKLSKGNHYLKVKEIFEWATANAPELLCLALAMIKTDINGDEFLFDEIINETLPLFLGNHINSLVVLEEVWNINKDLVIKTICTMYRSNPDLMNLSRILDITQKLKESLIPIVSCNDHNFTVNLAILAVKRDFLHIDQWLAERISKVGDDFIESLLGYIKENVISQCKDVTSQSVKDNILEKCQLSLESLAIIFENLTPNKVGKNPKVSKRIEIEITNTYKAIFDIFDELQIQPPNSEEIEEAANKLYQSLFAGEVSVEEIIEKMKTYKISLNSKESEIYACMIHSLLDEYQFYNQYPEKELRIISTLFGQTINQKLLDGIVDIIALKYVIEGIKKGSGNMYLFGTTALEQFVDKLATWPQYLQSVVSIIALKNSPALYEKVNEKYIEMNNKAKMKGEDMHLTGLPPVHQGANPRGEKTNNLVGNLGNIGNIQPFIPVNMNNREGFVNFDNQQDEKRERLNIRMPGISDAKDFNNNFMKNVSTTGGNSNNNNPSYGSQFHNQNPNTSQYGSKLNSMLGNTGGNITSNQSQQSQFFNPIQNSNNLSNMNANPDIFNMNTGLYFPPNMKKEEQNFEDYGDNDQDNKKNDDYFAMGQFTNQFQNSQNSMMNKFNNQNKMDEVKLLKQDLDNDSFKRNFNSGGDKNPNINQNINSNNNMNITNQARPRLTRPPSTTPINSNIVHILANENELLIEAPSEDIINKVTMILNSMGKTNIAEKANDLKLILNHENLIRWFSNFFIVNKVSSQFNFHEMYNQLIMCFDSKDLYQLVYKDTITLIKKFLSSEKITKDANEKKVLTNLGNWLGYMTLAKNKPVLAKDLDLKEIIFDAYENGKLTTILAFVTKIIEHSAKTKVFHPKNPWIQAILSVLAEMYCRPFLKPTLKFEIEIIFKKLEIDLNQYPQSRVLDSIQTVPNSGDFTKSQKDSESDFEPKDLLQKISSQEQYINEVIIFLNRSNPNLVAKSELLQILTNSLANAINEILAPVVERAVNISQVTTRELILKDFAFDKDESKFKNAANLCIKSLAGSLAMVTCKEPLRIGYNNQLKEILFKKGVDPEIIEAMNNSLNNSDILEIGCNFIQNYVIKRAIDKIEKDKVIIDELEKRKKSRPLDVKTELITKIKLLPEILRPNQSGLSNEQYRIYEDFDKVYEMNKKNENLNNKINLLKIIVLALQEVLTSYNNTNNQKMIIKNYEMCLLNIQYITKNNEATEYTDDDDQLSILSKMISESRITDANIANELANISYKYIVAFSKVQNLSLVNINSEILKGWIKSFPQLSKEITNKLLNSDDIQVRFKLDIHYYFFKKNIFDMNEYEKYMSDYLEEASMSVVVRKLISSLIEKNVLSVNNFKKIPTYLIDPNTSANYFDLFSKNQNNVNSNVIFTILDWKTCNIKDQNNFVHFRENCKMLYKQMLYIVYQNYDQDQIKIKLKDFGESSISKSEEQMNVFIMIITELAVRSIIAPNDPDNNFYPESEVKCIMCLLNITTTNKLKLFENILFGIFKVFHYDYTKNLLQFNQRPYFKILINLIHSLYVADNSEEMFIGFKKLQYFNILSDIMRVMKPQNYPGFSLAWLDIFSSKYFSSMFLENETGKLSKEIIPKYEKYLLPLIDLLAYLKSFNNEVIIDYNSKVFVDSVYKFIFLLSKSYPEFLSYYYYIVIASLPPGDNFLQMKNIILYSAPNDIEQPDPFYDDFKVDSLPDIRKNSVVLFDIGSILNDYKYKEILDEYINNKNENVLEELYKRLNKKGSDNIQNYLVINAIVIYWSQSIVKSNSEKRKNQEVLDFFLKMMKNLDPENRDNLINSILNELRYPSHQTYYFSCLLLCIFFEIKNEHIEEHILRNILERLLYKPYPWGILVTFVELSRHPKYQLDKKSYINKTHCDKIIEELVKFIKSSKLNKNLDNYVA